MNRADKIRILFLGHSGLRGGAEICLDTTLQFLDAEVFSASVILGSDGPMQKSAIKAPSVRDVKIMPLSWWTLYTPSWWQWKNMFFSPKRVWQLVRKIRREKINLVYTNTLCCYEGALAAWLAGVPHVWHIHEVFSQKHLTPHLFSLKRIFRWINQFSVHILFESQASLEAAQPWIEREKSSVVYNSCRFMDQGAFPKLDKMQKTEAPLTVAWMGRFSSRKNPLLLIHALEILLSEMPQLRETPGLQLLFVGEGPLEDDLRRLISEKNLKDICFILPFKDDVREILTQTDILVQTSDEESFGLVLVEAALYDIPVISTATQGPCEIIEDGITGYLVPNQDASELSNRLKMLLSNSDMRKKMGEMNGMRMMEMFHPLRNTKKIEKVLKNILGLQVTDS